MGAGAGMRITLDASVCGLTTPEAAVWGVLHYMTVGGWQQYGVMPPTSLLNCPCPESITSTRVAEVLHTDTATIETIWASLIQKGAISVE